MNGFVANKRKQYVLRIDQPDVILTWAEMSV